MQIPEVDLAKEQKGGVYPQPEQVHGALQQDELGICITGREREREVNSSEPKVLETRTYLNLQEQSRVHECHLFRNLFRLKSVRQQNLMVMAIDGSRTLVALAAVFRALNFSITFVLKTLARDRSPRLTNW